VPVSVAFELLVNFPASAARDLVAQLVAFVRKIVPRHVSLGNHVKIVRNLREAKGLPVGVDVIRVDLVGIIPLLIRNRAHLSEGAGQHRKSKE